MEVRQPMPALFGPVLTNTPTVGAFVSSYTLNRFSAAKVISGWGVDGGWTVTGRELLVRSVPRLIVRSVAGDPSFRGWGAKWYPDPDLLVEEFRPWVALRPDIWLEVGNEPDVVWDTNPVNRPELSIWVYHYWLELALRRLRAEFPRARLIAPSPRVGHYPEWYRWLEIRSEVTAQFDAVSLHLYGWHQIIGDGKGELEAAKPVYDRLFPGKSVALTEVGIHNPEMPHQRKLELYRDFARAVPENWRWVLFYHYNARRDIHPEYSSLP